MRITDLFRRLSYDQLSGLSWAGEGSGVIAEARRPALVQYANEGLLRLYSRFALKESEVVIEQQCYITSYRLHTDYAFSNPNRLPTVVPFILDSEDEPFKNDVVRVFAVNDLDGCAYPLNDSDAPRSVFTPTPNTLQVPNPMQGILLSLLYQARHEPLVHTNLEADIDLPEVLEPALLSYVAHKTFLPMNGQENSLTAAQHLQSYEAVCAEVVDRDLVSSSVSTTNMRFKRGGWR